MMGMYVILGPCLGFSVNSPPPWKVIQEGDAWTVSFWMSFCSSIMLVLDVFVSSSLHADTF